MSEGITVYAVSDMTGTTVGASCVPLRLSSRSAA